MPATSSLVSITGAASAESSPGTFTRISVCARKTTPPGRIISSNAGCQPGNAPAVCRKYLCHWPKTARSRSAGLGCNSAGTTIQIRIASFISAFEEESAPGTAIGTVMVSSRSSADIP